MIIKEYRVILPISVEEYQVGQLYTTAVFSKSETGGGRGVEVITNEPYDKDGETGQFTHKIYHMTMPRLISWIFPKSSLFHEKAWNAYPYCQTIITNEFIKDFFIKVETWHKPDMGEVDNVYGLDEEEWKNVEVVHINIADRSKIPREDYNPDADPAIFESEKTGRGPLGPDWKNEVTSDTNCPHMCVYKLVKVLVKLFGFQKKTEEYIQMQQKRMFTLFHRKLFCWIDKWIDMSMEDIRRLEEEIKNDLNQIMENSEYTGVGLVEEYQVGQLYATAVASKKETGGGRGVEVITNEPYDKNGETGQYTHKIYHMNLPKFISWFWPKSSLFHEKAWNAYPYCQTIVTNECMKDSFLIKIETWHKPDMGELDNVYGLDEEEWKNVEVVHINIADRSQIPRADYNPDADPAIFESEKTGRGPLGPDWKTELTSDTKCPHMCVYKLVKVLVKLKGFQNKTEEYIQMQQKRMFTLFHRQLFCWIDKWIDMSMEDIRRLEEDIKNDLNHIMENSEYTGVGLGD